ncbi:MAG: hypothetical protein KA801_01865 [Syntrophorhabdaceae bacterium]|nr:hypothetical protein [Syntrophorhabdaceae bacterium]
MKPKTGYCIGCDNRHGCKSKTPPCIDEMTAHNVSADSGKQYLRERNLLDLCGGCPFLRSCWTMEEYKSCIHR